MDGHAPHLNEPHVRCTLSLDGRDVEGRGTPARREAVLILPIDLTRGEVWYLAAGLLRTVEGLRSLLEEEGDVVKQ